MSMPEAIDAGQFRNRVIIQQIVKIPNRSGGYVKSWQTVPGCNSVPANITYPPPSKKGDEVISQHQKRSSVFTSIKIRYRLSTNLDASMRIVFGTRTFEIRSVLPDDEYKRFIVFQCEELQGKGSLH